MNMLRILSLFLLLSASLGCGRVLGQCTTCDQTYTGGAQSTDFSSLNTGQTLCIQASNTTDLYLDQNKSGLQVCVAPGATWTQNYLNPPGLTINVYGTFTFAGNYNANARTTINIMPGGQLITPTQSINNSLTINNQGTLTFTNSGYISVVGSVIINNALGAVFNATAATPLVIGNGVRISNAGTMNISNLEDSEALAFINESTGQMNISTRFYNHGGFTNNGVFQTTCTGSTGPCEFVMGDKGPDRFTNNGCMKITGNVIIDGPGTLNGTLEILPGYNLTINRIITGTNGQIAVDGGTSTITLAGQYTGTNMKFYDTNTAGNGFDVNQGNNPSLFTITRSGNTCSQPCPSVALTATPSACSPATGTYQLTGTVSVTGTSPGSLTITDGLVSTVVSVTDSAPQAYTLTGLTAAGTSHTVTAASASASCPGASTTYTAPVACACSMGPVSVVQSGCSNNNTPATTTDDTFTVQVTAQATNGSGRYEVVLNANPDGTGGTVLNPGGTPYATSFVAGSTGSFRADGTSTYTLIVRDQAVPTCFVSRTTTPVAACSVCKPSCRPLLVTRVRQ